MKWLCVGIHSLVLAAADLAGIALGAVAASRILGVTNQVWLQLPLAVALTLVLFLAWTWLLPAVGLGSLMSLRPSDRRGCLGLSLLWAPLVFVPLHYVTQGYLTRPGNLVALALYQLPVNALALFWAARLQASKA